MAITKLVWIALPNGLQDNGQTLRLAVYLAPALAAPPGTTVANFTPFNSWPVTAAGIRFQVSFDNGDSFSNPVSASYNADNALDTSLMDRDFRRKCPGGRA